jgi:hypothetical protein
MKKVLLATTLLLFFSGCSQTSNNKTQIEQTELTAIEKLPDFPMSLNSFVDVFNTNKYDVEFLTKIKDTSDIEFANFNDKGTLMKDLIKADGFDLKAVFTDKKKFKRLIFNHTGDSLPEENAAVLVNTFFTIGVDRNYLNDFLESEESNMVITENGYKIDFWFERDLGFLNITFDSEL